MLKLKVSKDDSFGNWIIIKEIDPVLSTRSNGKIHKKRRVLVECKKCHRQHERFLFQVIKNTGQVCNLCDLENKTIRIKTFANKTFAKGADSKLWTGCGKISGTVWGRIVRHAIRGSKVLSVDITIEDAWNQFLKQDSKCALTGQPLCFSSTSSTLSQTTASLDRIDSKKGYSKDNIQWVHKDINRMKWDFPEDHFIDLCKLVVKTKLNKEV